MKPRTMSTGYATARTHLNCLGHGICEARQVACQRAEAAEGQRALDAAGVAHLHRYIKMGSQLIT